ncbi:MAG: glycine--tRNA ligase [Candidatus Omnitrophica bacterium]|nr:glycine--tRNA ligase [Candidatus Omnitrophota bacterium]
MPEVSMDAVVALCKRRGFVFQSSEIYGGLASTWDYGPLGAELKRNVKNAWWKSVVQQRDDMEGLDAAILMHPAVWKASGHLDGFTDALVDCKGCKKRFRADHLPGQGAQRSCPECKAVIDLEKTPPRPFNLMLKTHLGAVEDESAATYMRPETAQGIFVNFLNVINSRHRKLPFGIAQIGKSFRNEITPGNFTFRTREFEQMEIEYFVRPEAADEAYHRWIAERRQWYLDLGMRPEKVRLRPHAADELAHYAQACTDIEYAFPFGWSELEGIANRRDFDLRQHAEHSGKDLTYFDQADGGQRFIPYVIEPSGGVDRAVLAFLADAYREEEVKGETRVVLGLHKELSPCKVAVLPLLKKRPELVEMAKKITSSFKKHFVVKYDDTAAIGKLYRRQDEIGTMYCVTVDVQSLDDGQVTVRYRDTMLQDRVAADRLFDYFQTKGLIGN